MYRWQARHAEGGLFKQVYDIIEDAKRTTSVSSSSSEEEEEEEEFESESSSESSSDSSSSSGSARVEQPDDLVDMGQDVVDMGQDYEEPLATGAGGGAAAANAAEGAEAADADGADAGGVAAAASWNMQLLLQYLADTDGDSPSVAEEQDFRDVAAEHLLASFSAPAR